MRPQTWLHALLLVICASIAAGQDGTAVLQGKNVLLWLDASEPGTATTLAQSVNAGGDGVWTDLSGNENAMQLYNAGYDSESGGSVVFIPPTTGSDGEEGTYGVRTNAQGVTAGSWGQRFSAVAWYRGADPASPSSGALLQVLGELGGSAELQSSALWLTDQFEDNDTSGANVGYAARPTESDQDADCWQQLAVVKDGGRLQFYRDAQPAGSASAATVVGDYGSSLALGVDYTALKAAQGVNLTAGDDLQLPFNWLNGSLAVVMVFDDVLSAADVAALHKMDASRFEDSGLCTPLAAPAPTPAPTPSQEDGAPALAPSPEPLAPSPQPSFDDDFAPSPGPSVDTAAPSPAEPEPSDDLAPSPQPEFGDDLGPSPEEPDFVEVDALAPSPEPDFSDDLAPSPDEPDFIDDLAPSPDEPDFIDDLAPSPEPDFIDDLAPSPDEPDFIDIDALAPSPDEPDFIDDLAPSPLPSSPLLPSDLLPPSLAPGPLPSVATSPAPPPSSPLLPGDVEAPVLGLSPLPSVEASPAPAPAPADLAPGPAPLPQPSPSPFGVGRPQSPSPVPAGVPAPVPTTVDVSTAIVTPDAVTNHITISGDAQDLLPFDDAKQQQLKEALLASLNLDPALGYSIDDIEVRLVEIQQADPARRKLLQSATATSNVNVVVEYTLKPTPEVPLDKLQQAELDSKLFIRVEADKMPYWQGGTTLCTSDASGLCTSQPITPAVVIENCSVDVCFLLDDSGSVVKAGAWNDITAAAYSIMRSIKGDDSKYAVWRFSNYPEPLGAPTTRKEVGDTNSLVRLMLDTPPRAKGTYTGDAVRICQSWLDSLNSTHVKTILLLTDGRPTDPGRAKGYANLAKQAGVRVVAVGAGTIDYDTLVAMASGVDAVFSSYQLDAQELQRLADSAAEGICNNGASGAVDASTSGTV